MSRHNLVVRFPDGTIKYGIYNGTIEAAMSCLFPNSAEAWDWWEAYYEAEKLDPLPTTDEPGVPVEVCDGVYTWTGRSTPEIFLGPYDPSDGDRVLLEHIAYVPAWAADALGIPVRSRPT